MTQDNTMPSKTPRTVRELRQDLDLYGKFCQHHTLKAQDVGNAVATHLFVTMLNPKYRGPKFTWTKFEDMAARQAESHAGLSFSSRIWNRYKSLIIESACHSARLTAKRLLKDSGVLEWLPLPPHP